MLVPKLPRMFPQSARSRMFPEPSRRQMFLRSRSKAHSELLDPAVGRNPGVCLLGIGVVSTCKIAGRHILVRVNHYL